MKKESALSTEMMSDQEASQLLERVDRALGEIIDKRTRLSLSQKGDLRHSLEFTLHQIETQLTP